MKASAWEAGTNTWGKSPADTPTFALPPNRHEESKWGQSNSTHAHKLLPSVFVSVHYLPLTM